MSVNNNIVTAPVGLQEVYSLLGVSPKNGVYDVGYLCSNTHGKINMWSRFKPVSILDTYNVDYSTAWYKGTLGDCGIQPRITTLIQDIITWYDDNVEGWEYMPPFGDKGGLVISPFRLLDFDGYKHNAMPPISGFVAPTEVREHYTFTCGVRTTSDVIDPTEPGSLALNEIEIEGKKLSQWYLGAVVTDTDGNIKIVAAGNKDKIDGTFGTGFPDFSSIGLSKNKPYYIYPFLSKEPQEQGEYLVYSKFIMLPQATRKTFEVISAEEYLGLEISLTASYLYLLGEKARITAKITVNCDKSAFTFNNNHIYFRFDTSAENSDLLIGEYTEEIPEFTVEGGGGTYTTQISYMIPSAYRSKSFYAYLMLNTGQFTRKAYPRETSNPDLGEPETPDLGGDLTPNP